MPSLVIEMGHCYRSTGATGTTGEQQYATRVADACISLLNGRSGWTVRKKLADSGSYAGNAFVAIHCDGSTNPSARGASIGYRNAAGQQFGQATMKAYARRGWTGGFRPDNYTTALAQYYGTGNALAAGNSRAFIMECGFRTNDQDRQLLDGPGGVKRIALSIGEALGIDVGGLDMEWSEVRDFVNPAGTYKETHAIGETMGHNFYRIADTYRIVADIQARFSILSGQISDDEANILSAFRSGVPAVFSPEQMQELKDAIKEAQTDETAEAVVNKFWERLAPGSAVNPNAPS